MAIVNNNKYQVFMNAIKTQNCGLISLSDNCTCKNKNYEITINFI